MSTLTTQSGKQFPFLLPLVLLGLTIFLLLRTMLQSVSVPLDSGISDWESIDVTISDFLLRSEVPEIVLTTEQLDEISALYSAGIEFNNDPNDPCQKLKLYCVIWQIAPANFKF